MESYLHNALAWAAQAQTTPAGGQAQPGPNPIVIMLVVIMILFYFLILRPQRREQKKRDEMINTLNRGDAVVTTGGIHGTVESVDTSSNVVIVNVAPKINLRFSRTAIAVVNRKKDRKEGEGEAKTE